MKRIITAAAALLSALLMFSACAGTPAETTAGNTPSPAPQTADIPAAPHFSLDAYPVVDGSTACIPLAEALIKSSTGCSDAEAELHLTFSTTDYSYDALAEGRADLLLVYEPSAPTMQKHSPAQNMDMRPIGKDALVFIVNADNPVESLTIQQIRDIYSGKITNWKDVGGLDCEIAAYQRPELSGSQTLMLNLCMKDTPMVEAPTMVASTMSDIIEAVVSNSNEANALGYSVYYYAQNMYAQPGLKFIAVEGVLPSNESINRGQYSFINPFYAILPKENAAPAAAALADYLTSEDGQKLVRSCGYVPYMVMD